MKKVYILIFILFISTGFVFSQSITVIQPNGGEQLAKGSSYPIKWNATGTTNPFKITLWRNGVLVGILHSSFGGGTGVKTFDWTVGDLEGGGKADLGSGYTIKVKEKTTPVSDESDGSFKIIITFAPLKVDAYRIPTPDLKVSIIPTPESPGIHENTNVRFRVDNLGPGTSGETKLRIFMGQTNTDTLDVYTLKPGRHFSIDKKLNPEGVGYINWAADVDHEMNIGDTNRSNNHANFKMIIRGPDLKITQIHTPDYKKTIQQQCKLRVTVKNIGSVKAGRFEVDCDWKKSSGIAQGRKYKVCEKLDPGQSVTFEFTNRYAGFGMKYPDIFVNKAKLVLEEDYNNNQGSAVFHVSGENITGKDAPRTQNF